MGSSSLLRGLIEVLAEVKFRVSFHLDQLCPGGMPFLWKVFTYMWCRAWASALWLTAELLPTC